MSLPERSAPEESSGATAQAGRLSRSYEAVKEFSKVAGLIGAVLLGALYALGASFIMAFYILFGVLPADVRLERCLELGILIVTELFTVLPLYLLFGFQGPYLGARLFFFFVLPILSFATLALLLRQGKRRLAGATLGLVTAGGILVIGVAYLYHILMLTDSGLFLNPAVNVAKSMGPGANLADAGLTDPTGVLSALLFDTQEVTRRVGILLLLDLSIPIYSLVLLRLANRVLSLAGPGRLFRASRLARNVLGYTAGLYTLLLLFWIPLDVSFMGASALPKVDVSIAGLQNLTSRNYLVMVGEYESAYSFYVPTEQDVIIAPKDKVEYIRIKGDVSAFEDRFWFQKGPWIGIRFGLNTTESGGAVSFNGLDVNEVYPGSPAHRAGILPGDRIIDLDGRGLKKLALDMPGILQSAPRDHPVRIVFLRNGGKHETEIWVEERP